MLPLSVPPSRFAPALIKISTHSKKSPLTAEIRALSPLTVMWQSSWAPACSRGVHGKMKSGKDGGEGQHVRKQIRAGLLAA